MQKSLLLLGLTVGGMSLVALSLVTQVSGVPADAAWSVFIQWTVEAWAVSAIAYLVLWRSMRKRDGLILKLHIGAHVCGVISTMIATAAVRMGVVFLFGGHAASNPEGMVQIFLFLVAPSSLAFAVIWFAMLRMHSVET
jgi:hypothetical protein